MPSSFDWPLRAHTATVRSWRVGKPMATGPPVGLGVQSPPSRRSALSAQRSALSRSSHGRSTCMTPRAGCLLLEDVGRRPTTVPPNPGSPSLQKSSSAQIHAAHQRRGCTCLIRRNGITKLVTRRPPEPQIMKLLDDERRVLNQLARHDMVGPEQPQRRSRRPDGQLRSLPATSVSQQGLGEVVAGGQRVRMVGAQHPVTVRQSARRAESPCPSFLRHPIGSIRSTTRRPLFGTSGRRHDRASWLPHQRALSNRLRSDREVLVEAG